jgi:MFS family permease
VVEPLRPSLLTRLTADTGVLSSLGLPNYRKYFIGVTASNIGTWMARTGQSWLVLMVLTDQSATALGYVNALMFLPTLLTMPFAGTFADRFPKRRILLISQVVMGMDAVMLAGLQLSGHIELWHVYLIAFIDGTAGSFDNPARAAFVSEVVGNKHLPNAISLNSASWNSARLFGPGIAGLLILAFGTWPVFIVDAVSFATMAIALISLKRELLHPAPIQTGKNARLVEGLRYLKHRPDLLVLIAIGGAVGGLGFNFTISNAVMATQHFGRGAGEYGVLGTLMGLGALMAAIISAKTGGFRMRFILGGMATYTLFSLLAAYSPHFSWFAALQVPIGLSVIVSLLGANSLLQTSTLPEMRGRVMMVWSVMMTGVTPVVSPAVGWLGDHLGPRSTVLFGVVAVGLSALLITWVIMRHHHIKLRLITGDGMPRLRVHYGDAPTLDINVRR